MSFCPPHCARLARALRLLSRPATHLSAPRTFLLFSCAAKQWATAQNLQAHAAARGPPAILVGTSSQALLRVSPSYSSSVPSFLPQEPSLSGRSQCRQIHSSCDGRSSRAVSQN